MLESISISNKTKSTLPRVPFDSIKEAILGKKYILSVVFIGEKRSRELNNSYRNKNRPTNVLSFVLDKKNGEIFLTPRVAKKEAHKFDKNYAKFIGLLFIHGCLHLKGMEHSSRMDKTEEKFYNKFFS